MKVTFSEINKNPHGTNREGKEAWIQTNNLKHKKDINIQTEQKERVIQKIEDKLRNLRDISKSANIRIMGFQKDKRKSKKLKTYLKK